MTNPNTDPDALERLLWEEPPADCKNTCEWMDGHAMRCHDVIRVLAAEAAQAQAQSGVSDAILKKALEISRSVGIETGHLAKSPDEQRMRAVLQAITPLLAAAPQPQTAEPAYQFGPVYQYRCNDDGTWVDCGPDLYEAFPDADRRILYTHPQPAQDASKYQELLMAVEKKFPGESRHETALRYLRETELQSCEPKCDAAMAKESGDE